MSFLAPLYFLGVLAVGLPLVFHLWKRHVRGEQLFSTLMFLDPAPPRATTRHQLNDWWLLILRAFAVTLLAVAFTRPLWQIASTADEGSVQRRVVVLVDTSASLQREELWSKSLEMTREELQRNLDVGELAVFRFAADLHPVLTSAEWKALPREQRVDVVMRRLQKVRAGGATNLVRALQVAEEELRATSPGGVPVQCELVLVSDLQHGGLSGGATDWRWPAEWPVTVREVTPGAAGNAGLVAMPLEDGRSLDVRVTNTPDATSTGLTLRGATVLDDAAVSEQIQVAAGAVRTIRVPATIDGQPLVRLTLSGDAQDFDNELVLPNVEVLRQQVVWFGNDSANDPQGLRYYLERAVPRSRFRQVEVVDIADVDVAAALQNGKLTPGIAPLLVFGEGCPEPVVSAVGQMIEQGCIALVVLRRPDDIATAAALADVPGLSAEEHPVTDYELPGELDFEHPLLQAFSGVEFANFTGIPIWRRRVVTLPETRNDTSQPAIPIRFANGDPALMEFRRGAGAVFVLAFGWQPADSQLARSSKFPPLIHALLDMANFRSDPGDRVLSPGTTVRLTVADTQSTESASGTLSRPDGTTEPLPADVRSIIAGEQPGRYRWRQGEAGGSFVVQLPASESQTTPLTAEERFALGLPTDSATSAAKTGHAAGRESMRDDAVAAGTSAKASSDHTVAVDRRRQQTEQQQAWWQWALLAAALVLCGETFLAGRSPRTGEATESVAAGGNRLHGAEPGQEAGR